MAGLLFLMLTTAPIASAQAGDPAPGGQLYEARCQSCHLLTGEPREAIERLLDVEMRDLSSSEVQVKSSEELRRDIVEGTGKMSPVTNLNERAVADLLAYPRSLAAE